MLCVYIFINFPKHSSWYHHMRICFMSVVFVSSVYSFVKYNPYKQYGKLIRLAWARLTKAYYTRHNLPPPCGFPPQMGNSWPISHYLWWNMISIKAGGCSRLESNTFREKERLMGEIQVILKEVKLKLINKTHHCRLSYLFSNSF